MMEYLSIKQSQGSRDKSITVTNVDNENTVFIEGFMSLERQAEIKSHQNYTKDTGDTSMNHNPSNHLYHRFDRESKHPKKRKFVYFDPNEPKKLFGVKNRKPVDKKKEKQHSQSTSPQQLPSSPYNNSQSARKDTT
jgi:hypothetical protein